MSETPSGGRLGRLVIAGCLGVAFGLAAYFGSFDPYIADIKYDWVVAQAALHSNAHLDVLDLAAEFGVDIYLAVPESMSRLHPRTPGAILLALPLTLIPFGWLVAFSIGASVALVSFVVYPTVKGLSKWPLRLATLFTAISMPVVTTLWFGTQSALVAFMVLVGWSMLRRTHQVAGGVLLGAAVTLKVFPALLFVPLLLGKRRLGAAWMAGSAVAFALIGLLLPGVSLGGSIEALTGATETWVFAPPNASLYPLFLLWGVPSGMALAILGLVAGGGVFYLARSHRTRATKDPLPWVVLGLLLIPLSWVHYDLVVLPAVLALLVDFLRKPRLITGVAPILWFIPSVLLFFDAVNPGPWFLASRVALLAVWLSAPIIWTEQDLGGKWETGDVVGSGVGESFDVLRKA